MEGDGEIQIRLAVNDDYDTVLYGAYDSSIVSSRVLEDDEITIYGTSAGLISYDSTMGGKITIPAVLIDSPSDINPDDFTGVDVVLLTAGASAHEYVVKLVTEYFQSTFNAQVEEERTCEENTVFPIPSMP